MAFGSGLDVEQSTEAPPSGASRACEYFVDEAGDPVLFNRKKQVVIGREGCSRYFLLGKLRIADPTGLTEELDRLRASLLADPYFRSVPSMQPEQGKTAVAFHAKDDLPEVRREVYRLLMSHDVWFHAVVREKRALLEDVRRRNAKQPDYRYRSDELYDQLVSHLFVGRLHKHPAYRIHFATRGSSDRSRAFGEALEKARRSFSRKWKIPSDAPATVHQADPRQTAGLQAVDYFLWALQRMYERREPRWLEYVWPRVSLVRDLDDRRQKGYGVYYAQKNPLTLDKMKEPRI